MAESRNRPRSRGNPLNLSAERLKEQRLLLAKLFKYLAQWNNPYVRYREKFDDISFKSYYRTHKDAIDRLYSVLAKYRIDAPTFLRFALKQTTIYTPELVLRPGLFLEYARRKEERNRFEKIYSYFRKSVDNVAKTCLERDMTAKEFVRELIVKNRLAYEFVSGRVSKYFIASMQNFKQIYRLLDEMNKSELRIIYNAADELNAMLQDACLMKTGSTVKPMAAVESRIKQLQTESSKTGE